MVYPPRVNSGVPDGAPECISCKIQLRPTQTKYDNSADPTLETWPRIPLILSSPLLLFVCIHTRPKLNLGLVPETYCLLSSTHLARLGCIADEVHLLLSTKDQSLA